MKPDIEELRKKYIKNPPEGMTSEDIRHMSGDDLLVLHQFFTFVQLYDTQLTIFFAFSYTLSTPTFCPEHL